MKSKWGKMYTNENLVKKNIHAFLVLVLKLFHKLEIISNKRCPSKVMLKRNTTCTYMYP